MGDRDVDKADGYNNVAIAIHHEFFRLSQSPTKKKTIFQLLTCTVKNHYCKKLRIVTFMISFQPLHLEIVHRD